MKYGGRQGGGPRCSLYGEAIVTDVDTHCSDGGTCDANGFCTGCGGEQPYYWDGECVQCLEDSHCAQGTICNQQTKACGAEAKGGADPGVQREQRRQRRRKLGLRGRKI